MFWKTKNIKTLFDIFKQSGFNLRIVGGAVRDFHLSKTPSDIDFCTDATPSQMAELAKKCKISIIPTGIKHGTVTFNFGNNEQYEVTTLRIDNECDGRHADVMFTTSFEKDAERRDFTINAMSMDNTGKIFDYFGGITDIKNQTIRFVGNPSSRIKEDYLRVLRFFRFMEKFEGDVTLDAQALDIINEEWVIDGLRNNISVERIWSELSKMLMGKHTLKQFEYLNKCNILRLYGIDISLHEDLMKNSVINRANYLARFSTMLENPEQVIEKLKMSGKEHNEIMFYFNNLNNTIDEWTIKRYLISGIDKKWCTNLIRIKDRMDLRDMVHSYKAPKFPVSGKNLIDIGLIPSPEFGDILRELKNIWLKDLRNGNELTTEQLMNEVENVRRNTCSGCCEPQQDL